MNPANPPRQPTIFLVFAGLGVMSYLAILITGAYFLGRSQGADPAPPRAVAPTTVTQGALTPAPPAPVAPSAAPPAPVPALVPAPAPADPSDERVMTTASHGRDYAFPLLFHYAHVRGQGIADVHGRLNHRDEHYFELGPGDSLTLEAPEGQEFTSDGTDGVFDLEIEVHPNVRESHNYEVDVSHAHLDVNGPWVTLGHGDAHEWDLDHVGHRVARYVRIRNLDRALPLYIDGVYVRGMRVCADASRCHDVNHLVRR